MPSAVSHSLRRTLCLFILLLTCVTTVDAQFRATVQGTVLDANKAVVVDASIILINKETNRTLQAISSDEGFYRFDNLAPGKYVLVVERKGFKKKMLADVDVKAEETQGINIQLEPGEIVETVTVSADLSDQLKTENANIARSISEQEILRLPQYGRDPYELVRLAPGVFGLGARICCGLPLTLPNVGYPFATTQSIFSNLNRPQISANGQRVSTNGYEVDGVNVNSQVFGGTAILTPNQESIKEVRVAATSYSAESGGNTGALIQIVSQNGTNEFHGSAFFKYNDPALNAFQRWGGYFGGPPTRDARRDRQWGGSLGGPIYLPQFGEGGPLFRRGKDTLFFFFSYETSRRKNRNYQNAWIETPEYRQVLRIQRPTSIAATILSAVGMEPRLQSIISRTCESVGLNDPATCATLSAGLDIGSPMGTVGQRATNESGGGLDGIPDLQFGQILFTNRNQARQFNGRIDYQVNSNDLVALSFYATPVEATTQNFRPSDDFTFVQRNVSGLVLWSHRVSASTVNEARFNLTRTSQDDLRTNPNLFWGIPLIQIGDFPFCCPSLDFGHVPTVAYQTSYSVRDVLSKIVNNHGLKLGGEVIHDANDEQRYAFATFTPSFAFQGLWDFANDAPMFEQGTFDPRTGVPTGLPHNLRSHTYAFFIQDDWKLLPNLTVNLGLRWDYFAPPRERFDKVSIFVLGPDQNALKDARFKIGGAFYEPDRNNFGPQVGFAWSPKRIIGHEIKDRLIVRGGFGVAYNRIPQYIMAQIRTNPPFFIDDSFLTDTEILYSLAATLQSHSSWPSNPSTIRQFDPVTNMPLAGLSARVFAAPQGIPNPYSYRYSFGVEYSVASDWMLSIGYQGSATHKLQRFGPLVGPRNPQLNVALLTTDVNANFNGLLAGLTHRFAKRFSLNANYRWGKSIDGCSDHLGCASNTFYRRQDRAPSDFDVTHYFVAWGLWDLPSLGQGRNLAQQILGDWHLSGILTTSSGFPWNPTYDDLSRPVAYLGGSQETSNAAFMRPGGSFGPNASQLFVPSTIPRSAATPDTPAIGRNVFRGPRYFAVDMSLVKRINLPKFTREGDSVAIDLRANFFNIFNNLNLDPIYGDNTIIGSRPDGPMNPNFSRALGALSGRVIEFQARLSF